MDPSTTYPIGRSAVKRTIILTALLGALALPCAAHAEWFFTKQGAEHVARDAITTRYNDYGFTAGNTVAKCRPQGRAYDPAFKYHRWVCGWAGKRDDGDVCGGTLLIVGSNGAGQYYHKLLRGGRC
jgi:hypothetical protein